MTRRTFFAALAAPLVKPMPVSYTVGCKFVGKLPIAGIPYVWPSSYTSWGYDVARMGVWEQGGRLFLFGKVTMYDFSTQPLIVFYSDDDGATWQQGPVGPDTSNYVDNAFAIARNGTRLLIGFPSTVGLPGDWGNGGGLLWYQGFDMATCSWDSEAVDGGPEWAEIEYDGYWPPCHGETDASGMPVFLFKHRQTLDTYWPYNRPAVAWYDGSWHHAELGSGDYNFSSRVLVRGSGSKVHGFLARGAYDGDGYIISPELQHFAFDSGSVSALSKIADLPSPGTGARMWVGQPCAKPDHSAIAVPYVGSDEKLYIALSEDDGAAWTLEHVGGDAEPEDDHHSISPGETGTRESNGMLCFWSVTGGLTALWVSKGDRPHLWASTRSGGSWSEPVAILDTEAGLDGMAAHSGRGIWRLMGGVLGADDYFRFLIEALPDDHTDYTGRYYVKVRAVSGGGPKARYYAF